MTKNKQKKNKAESKTKKENFKEKFNDLNDKHLRLHAEFENFKRRTAKERIDLYSTAGENILISILPILDDFERAIKTLENEKENEGMLLIYSKFKTILEQKGLKIMDNPIGKDLNTR